MDFLKLFSNGSPSDYAVLLFAIKIIYTKIQEWLSKVGRENKAKEEAKAKEESRKRIHELNTNITKLIAYTVDSCGDGNIRLKEAVSLGYSNKEAATIISKILDTNGPLSKQMDTLMDISREIFDRQTQIQGKIEALSHSH